MPRNQGTSRKGKPKKGERAAGMGRALERSQQKRFRPKQNGSSRGAGMAMAPGTQSIGLTDNDGPGMKSVLEMDDLNDFLTQAEMAGREFESERERFVVVDPTGTEYRHEPVREPRVQWEDQPHNNHKKDSFVFRELSVPRRPAWDEDTTAQDLDHAEKESFLEWRRAIAAREEELMKHQDNSDIPSHHHYSTTVTPFEKNLEVWRQLWRVLERSSCVVQIVDARNPLFYLSKDLRRYATEELGKPMILVINKSDYLSSSQRRAWHVYLKQHGWDHVFFSAYEEQQKLDDASAAQRRIERNKDAPMESDDESGSTELPAEQNNEKSAESREETATEKTADTLTEIDVGVQMSLTREQLLDWLHDFAVRFNCEPDARYDNRIQFGMVGFPNVGKSSVINVLVGSSKHAHGITRVAVAAQPGKTKHYQTVLLERNDMMMCDCPGLVFPSFVSSTADLIAAGVYPIAQMRDHWPVVELICRRIPRALLEAHYGIQLPKPTLQDLKERGLADADGDSAALPPPTAEELLSTYCTARSMLAAASGVPDYQRAARVIIKDYAEGKLLYCHAPPLEESSSDMDAVAFHRETLLTSLRNTKKLRAKLSPLLDQVDCAGMQGEENDNTGQEDNLEGSLDCDEFDGLGIEDDDDLLDLVGGYADRETGGETPNGGKRGKKHKSRQKHGKKGRKDRNKDPYGCQSNPDDMLTGRSTGGGLIVNAGKYGKRGYTRPNYAGARAAVQYSGSSMSTR